MTLAHGLQIVFKITQPTTTMFDFLKKLLGETTDSEILDALQQKPCILDVRTPAEFQKNHVSGAVNIPIEELFKKIKLLINKL